MSSMSAEEISWKLQRMLDTKTRRDSEIRSIKDVDENYKYYQVQLLHTIQLKLEVLKVHCYRQYSDFY